MFDRLRYSSHFPEREPKPEDYKGVDCIDLVHMSLGGKPSNPREALVQSRLQHLVESGVQIFEVDIETAPPAGAKKIVVAGVIEDVCVTQRRIFLRNLGIDAKIDTALTSDY